MQVHEVQPAMRLLRLCQSQLSAALAEVEKSIERALTVAPQAIRRREIREEKERVSEWEARKAALIARDQERRRGPIRQSLERVAKQPSAKREPTLAERMARAWERNQHLLQTA